MNVLILKLIFATGILASTIIRYPYAKLQKQNQITDNRKTKLESFLLWFVFLGMIMTPLIYLFTSLFSFADYSLPIWANTLGIVGYFLAMCMFWKTHRDLGQNWSPTLEVREQHNLITNGIYKIIRHPMYASVWIWCVAQVLLLPNYVAVLAGIVSFSTLYFLRVGNEEKMMLDQFKEEYQAYMQRTGRLIPKLF